ncbi:MAG: Sec-independent protein translocase protein TatB [Sphingobium sp.]
MLDIGSTELLMIVIVAVVVIGPKDLPRALHKVGKLVGKARAMSRHFRSGIDAMIHEVEMEELEKKWAAENRRIMEQHPSPEALPAPEMEPQAAIADVAPAQASNAQADSNAQANTDANAGEDSASKDEAGKDEVEKRPAAPGDQLSFDVLDTPSDPADAASPAGKRA